MTTRINQKTFKTTIAFIVMICIGFATPAFAKGPQAKRGVHPNKAFTYKKPVKVQRARLNKRMAQLDKRLNLSRVQHRAMKSAIRSQQANRRAILKNYKNRPAVAKRALRTTRQAYLKRVRAILTPSQLIVFKRIQHQHMINKRLSRIGKKLNLTVHQKRKIARIQKSKQLKMQSVRRSKISPELQRVKLKAIERQARKNTMAILTPKQKAKMRKINQRYI